MLLLVAVPAAAQAGTLVVRSGDLEARVATDPWRMSFADLQGRVLVQASTGRGASPAGALGARVGSHWIHATRALATRRSKTDGGERGVTAAGRPGAGPLDFVLATTDPRRRLRVRIAPDAPGVVSVRAAVEGSRGGLTALGAGFRSTRGERFLGLGERATGTDHRGETVESYVSDGPYLAGERPLLSSIIPAAGWRPRDDSTYYPVPWLLSTRGYGVLVDNAETTYHRLGTTAPREWSVEVTSAPEGTAPRQAPSQLALRVFGGGTPAAALRRFTARTGRQPAAPAPWLFGPWFQPGGTPARQLAQVRRLRRADAPLSVVQTYTHYLPCSDQRGRRGAERARVGALHALGAAVTTYLNPMVCRSNAAVYDRAARTGGLTRGTDGRPYLYRYVTSRPFEVGQFDFTTAAGRAAFGRVVDDVVADGHDGWMEDFGEYTPLDSRSGAGIRGTREHNRYATDYHCAAAGLAARQRRPLVRFQRSGWTGAARCATVVWGGDPSTGWGFDGLAGALRGALGLGLSGVSTWGSDIGGFFTIDAPPLTGELLRRWVQLGALSPVMRTERDGIAIPRLPRPRPQVEDRGQIANWRRWTKLHTQLYPYLEAAQSAYRRTGLPIMRQLALAYPSDRRAGARDDEYLFGPDLLAAPVLDPGGRTRRAYLPAGTWVDLWRSARYERGSGGLSLTRPRLLHGGATTTLPAAPDEAPLLVRAGALLPLLSPDVETLAGGGRGVVHLADRLGELRILAFPRGRSQAAMFARDRLRSREGPSGWRLAVDGVRRRRIGLQASLGTLHRPFAPCAVRVGGRRLPARAWAYDAQSRVLRARFAIGHGVLEALRRGRAGCDA